MINTIAYHMRKLNDVKVLTMFAIKIGQADFMEQMLEDGEENMEDIMENLLKAWQNEVDATEENAVRFLSEFPEFSECVSYLQDYLKQIQLKRPRSMSNLFDRGGYRGSVR